MKIDKLFKKEVEHPSGTWYPGLIDEGESYRSLRQRLGLSEGESFDHGIYLRPFSNMIYRGWDLDSTNEEDAAFIEAFEAAKSQ